MSLIHHGDCIEVMRTLPTESVDAIVTSPPYAEQRKSTYGGISEADYPAWTVAWMAEAWRLLKPDGSVLINIRPHIRDGQISDYTLRTRLALREVGWTECEELIWHKTNGVPMGSLRRPRRSWESINWFAKHGDPYVDTKAAGQPGTDNELRISKSAASRNGWSHDHMGSDRKTKRMPKIIRVTDVFMHPKISHRQFMDHPAPFPWQLAEWCGKLICPPGGTILDPFSGSASTGIAAIRNGWDYVGIESVAEYVTVSRERLEREEAS